MELDSPLRHKRMFQRIIKSNFALNSDKIEDYNVELIKGTRRQKVSSDVLLCIIGVIVSRANYFFSLKKSTVFFFYAR